MIMNNKVTHLSHTGLNAGLTFCEEPKKEDETSCHLPYVKDLDAWADEHISCKACKQVLKEA